MDIFTAVMMFISLMGNNGYRCEIDEIAEYNAIVSCQNEHVGTTEWLDIRDKKTILMSNFKVV